MMFNEIEIKNIKIKKKMINQYILEGDAALSEKTEDILLFII